MRTYLEVGTIRDTRHDQACAGALEGEHCIYMGVLGGDVVLVVDRMC